MYRRTPSSFGDAHQNASPPTPADATPTQGSGVDMRIGAVGHQTQAPQPAHPLNTAFPAGDQDWLNGYVLSDCSEPATPQHDIRRARTETAAQDHAPPPPRAEGRANDALGEAASIPAQPRGYKRPRTGSSPSPFLRHASETAENLDAAALEVPGAAGGREAALPPASTAKARLNAARAAYAAAPAAGARAGAPPALSTTPYKADRSIPPGLEGTHSTEFASYITRKTNECNQSLQAQLNAYAPRNAEPLPDSLGSRNLPGASVMASGPAEPAEIPEADQLARWEMDLVAFMREEPDVCRAFIQSLTNTRAQPATAGPARLSTTGQVLVPPAPPVQHIAHVAHFEIPAPQRKALWSTAMATEPRPASLPAFASRSAPDPATRPDAADQDGMEVDPPQSAKSAWPANVVGDFAGTLQPAVTVPTERSLQSSVHAWPHAPPMTSQPAMPPRPPSTAPPRNQDAEDPEVRASELTRAGIITVMEKPPGGFPEKHGRDPLDLVRGMLRTTVSSWETCPEDSYFGVELLGYTDEDDPGAARELVVRTITALTGATGFRVDAPPPPGLRGPEGDFSPLFLVSEMPPAKTRTLKARRAWPTPDASLYVHRALRSPSLFVLGYFGFVSDDKNHVQQVITQNWLSPDFQKELMIAIAKDPRTPKNAVLDIVARDIVLSVRIDVRKVVGGKNHGAVAAAVYCDPPTSVHEDWISWRDRLLEMPLANRYGREAIKILPPMRCSGCHAGDHNYSDCPFRVLPGWYGPPRFPRVPSAPMNAATARPAQTDLPPPAPPRPGPSHAEAYTLTRPPPDALPPLAGTNDRPGTTASLLPAPGEPVGPNAITHAPQNAQHDRAAPPDLRARPPQQPRAAREEDFQDFTRASGYAPRGRPYGRATHRNRTRHFQPPQPAARAAPHLAYGPEDYAAGPSDYEGEYDPDGYAPPPYGAQGAFRGPPPPYYGTMPRGGGGRRGGRPYMYFPFPQ